MTSVYLIEVARKLPSRKRASYYVLRWPGRDGKLQEESLGRSRKSGGKLMRGEAEALRRKKEQDIGCGKIQPDKSRKMTLGRFREFYTEQRRRGEAPHTRRFLKRYPKLCEETIDKHDMVLLKQNE